MQLALANIVREGNTMQETENVLLTSKGGRKASWYESCKVCVEKNSWVNTELAYSRLRIAELKSDLEDARKRIDDYRNDYEPKRRGE